MSKFYGLSFGLDEMQRTLQRQLESVASIKNAIRSYFGAISVLVALIGTLQVFTGKVQPGWGGWYLGGLAAVLVVYLGLLSVFLVSLWPTPMTLPIDPEWDELVKAFDGKSESEAVDIWLAAVLNAVALNRPVVRMQTRLSQAVAVLFGMEIILLTLLAFIPRV